MLKSAARAQERDFLFPGVADGEQCALHAAIGTRRDAPQAAERSDARGRNNFFGGDPFMGDWNVQHLGRTLQRQRNGLMCRNRLIVVADEADGVWNAAGNRPQDAGADPRHAFQNLAAVKAALTIEFAHCRSPLAAGRGADLRLPGTRQREGRVYSRAGEEILAT